MFHQRLGCSSISFRHQELATALHTMRNAGFEEIDLGALPGVCDHVPYVLDAGAVEAVTAVVFQSGMSVRSVNGDVGDLNATLDAGAREGRERHLEMLLALASKTGAKALVLPCGAIDHEPKRGLSEDIGLVAAELIHASQRAAEFGVELWTESLHYFRLCWNTERAQLLADRLAGSDVGIVMDFSHVVASGGNPVDFVSRFGERIKHVHLRDAEPAKDTEPGNIKLSIGNGNADFAAGLSALRDIGYPGHFSLELETRDVTHDERPAAAAKAASFITDLI
jgi:sugar phosphate isomerase/epimerase